MDSEVVYFNLSECLACVVGMGCVIADSYNPCLSFCVSDYSAVVFYLAFLLWIEKQFGD